MNVRVEAITKIIKQNVKNQDEIKFEELAIIALKAYEAGKEIAYAEFVKDLDKVNERVKEKRS